MDWAERNKRADWVRDAESKGLVADSMAARISIVERMNRGEITLEQAQKEIALLKRNAKKNGQVTRNQAFKGELPHEH